jgi:hypothetical protein
MAQQTSVEWFAQEINKINVSTEARLFINKLKDQAKEMHEQEIINAVNLSREKRWYNALLYNSSGEKYYQETFKNK